MDSIDVAAIEFGHARTNNRQKADSETSLLPLALAAFVELPIPIGKLTATRRTLPAQLLREY
ncbi:MAG TPA: hypothetical protein V6C91_11975 [Coleofasciculaceae cyanobacterium]